VTSEIEERIHKALKPHPLERIEDGYRLVHNTGSGISTLRLLPVNEVRDGPIPPRCVAGSMPWSSSRSILHRGSVHGAYMDPTVCPATVFSYRAPSQSVGCIWRSCGGALDGQPGYVIASG